MNRLRLYGIMFIVGVVGLISSWFAIHYLSVERITDLFLRENRERAKAISLSLKEVLQGEISRVRFLGRSIESDPSTFNIRRLFREFYEGFKGGILAVQWIDENGSITEGFPPEHTPYGYGFLKSKTSSAFFERLKSSRDVVISRSIRLSEGDWGLSIAYPVRKEGRFFGAVNVVLSYRGNIGPRLYAGGGFFLVDADGGIVVYSTSIPGIVGSSLKEAFDVDLPAGKPFSFYLRGKLGEENVLLLFEETSVFSRSWYVSLISKAPFFSILGFTKGVEFLGAIGVFFAILALVFGFLSLRELFRYERRFKEERNYLGRVLGSIGNPLVLFDKAGRVVFSNDYACELFGSSLEGKGCPFFSIPLSSCRLHSDLETRGSIRQEFKLKDRTLDVNCALLRGEQGEVEGMILVARDITDNKKYEARLWDLARRLERKIWEEHILFELSKLIVLHKGRREFVKEALDLIYSYFPAILVFIAFLDERWRILRVEEVKGGRKEVKDLLISERGFSRVIDSGEILYVPDTRGRPFVGRNFDVETLSELMIPLMIREKVIGVLFLGSDRVNAFSEEDRNILKAAGDMVAIGMENTLLYQRLEELATVDDLTGLYNRRFFYQRLSEEIARARRQDTNLFLVFIDLDNFKVYNDTFGHLAGDKLLRVFGEVLRGCLRKGMDYAFRYGGDEFAVLLTAVSYDTARKIAERIAREFERYEFEIVSLSFGIAEYDVNMSEESFIASADLALYEAKRRGGRGIVFYRDLTCSSSPSSEAPTDSTDSSSTSPKESGKQILS